MGAPKLKLTPSEALPNDPAPGQLLQLDAAAVEEYRASGRWAGRTVRSLLSGAASRTPDALALVGYRSGEGSPERLTYREFDERVRATAVGLERLGVRAGDAVAVMLPNRIEFPVLIFAIVELGAVYVGIPATYGEREMFAILRRSRAVALVTMSSWRGNESLATARRIRSRLPDLRTVVVVDSGQQALGEAEVAWDDLTSDGRPERPDPDPIVLCHIGFTSGTTGEPKGVMNNHEALVSVLTHFLQHVGSEVFGPKIVQLVASPIGHHSGFLWGVLMTVELGGTVVLMDRWSPTEAAHIIRNEGVTTMVNAPTFLQDLLTTELADDPDGPLRAVVLAGAPIPRNLPATAAASVGAFICPAWGMTEFGIAVSCAPHLPPTFLRTDGVPLPGAEVRIVDREEGEVPAGVEGDLLLRGAGLFLGYFDRPDETINAFTSDGWFRTGDRAVLDEQGAVSLRGRSKDIVIRGGENVPVAEIESLIFAHPEVVNVAVVGYPDDRLGERVAAVVVLHTQSTLDLDGLCRYLMEAGASKHFLPERLEVRDELPMTMSGKLRKSELRRQFAAEGGGDR